MTKNELDKMAQKRGYDKAKYIGKWGKFSVYIGAFNKEQRPRALGCLPALILTDGENARYASIKEADIINKQLVQSAI